MPSVIHFIVNPAAGAGKASEFVKENALPLLDATGIKYEVHDTRAAKDAGRIGRELLEAHSAEGNDEALVVAVAGGDGTAHELIEGLAEAKSTGSASKWELVILPCGTANALFYSLFQDKPAPEPTKMLGAHLSKSPAGPIHQLSSLILALRGSTQPRPLPITLTDILPPSTTSTVAGSSAPSTAPDYMEGPVPGSDPPDTASGIKDIPSHVVLSTSLHASILHDSEALRASMPGVERFKVAAEQNLPVAYLANVILKGPVKQYSPKTKSFVEPFTATSNPGGGASGSWDLDGPFSYLLSSTITSRLEPTFFVVPTLSNLPPDATLSSAGSEDTSTMDIVVVRPMRDPVVRQALGRGDEAAVAEARAKRIGEVAGDIYNGGKHIDMTYLPDGSGGVEYGGEGEPAVEVFRVQGFDWVPTDPSHPSSHYVCADGDIHIIPSGGKASVRVAQPSEIQHRFYVWG